MEEREIIPPLSFPEFPVLTDAVRDEESGRVSVPDGFLVALAEYKIKIAETQKNYEAWRAIYEVKE